MYPIICHCSWPTIQFSWSPLVARVGSSSETVRKFTISPSSSSYKCPVDLSDTDHPFPPLTRGPRPPTHRVEWVRIQRPYRFCMSGVSLLLAFLGCNLVAILQCSHGLRPRTLEPVLKHLFALDFCYATCLLLAIRCYDDSKIISLDEFAMMVVAQVSRARNQTDPTVQVWMVKSA